MGKNYLLASPISSGKSYCLTDTVIRLVKEQGVNVILSVHNTKTAVEYKTRFDSAGVKSFIVSSHESTFGHQATPPKEVSTTDLSCLWYYEIQQEIKLGVTSQSYKEEYCNGCPLNPESGGGCPFVSQYQNVMDEKYKVVIIQHSHFSAPEVIYKLLDKDFAATLIDETFITSLFDYIQIRDREVEIIESKGYDWSIKLFNWMTCRERAKGKLDPSKDELEALYEDFRTWECEWRIPDLIRYYNQHRIVNPLSGIEVVYELPSSQLTVLADATPPVELIKHLTGIEDLTILGANEVIDIKAINPNNHRYQIIDISSSKSKLSNEEFFTALMDKICQIIKTKYCNKNSLLTVYESNKVMVRQFINEKYPEILPFIDIGLMNKGTNKWAHYDCQFILAGRYRLAKDYYLDTYKYRSIANYHRQKKGLKLFNNPYPIEVTEDTDFKKDWIPVKFLQRIDEELKIVEINDLKIPVPAKEFDPDNEYYWFNLIDEMDIGEMEQCERIRWFPEVAKEVYHCHRRFMQHLEVEPLLFEEFLLL